jgi:Ca2+/Na+ antiporter
LEKGLNAYLLATVFFAIIFCFFWLFVKSKSKLERWEGVVLFLIYLVFILAEFLRL